MSRKRTKSKPPKRRRPRPSNFGSDSQPNLDSDLTLFRGPEVPSGMPPGMPPMLNPDELLDNGMPPELVEMVMEAQQQALRGNLGPLQQLTEIFCGEDDSLSETDERSAHGCYPLSSPDAAEALLKFFSEDTKSAGYVVAAMKAIKLDPSSVDALVTLGDVSDLPNQRLRLYRQASEAANSKPRAVVSEHMPMVRLHMGTRLTEEAAFSEAIEIMLPGLDENPEDPDGLRFALIGLMLRLHQYDDLLALLDRFLDDPFGPGSFARAIHCFQTKGSSRHADALLRAAHEAKPLVAPQLVSPEPPPPQGVGHFGNSEQEESLLISECLLPGIRAAEGTTRWIRDTLDVPVGRANSASMSERIDCPDLIPGSSDLGDAMSLCDGAATWQYFLQRSDEGFYWAGLLEDSDLVAIERFAKRPNRQQLRRFLLDSVCEPLSGQPRKPRLLRLPTKADVDTLQNSVGTYGVACEQHRLSKQEKETIEHAVSRLSKLEDARSELDLDVPIDLSNLPQTDEEWLTGVFHPPMWIGDRATPYRTYLMLVVDASNGMIVATNVMEECPSPELRNATLANAMQHPAVGEPRRPQRVIVDPETPIDSLEWQDSSLEIVSGDEVIRSLFNVMICDLLAPTVSVDSAISVQPGITGEFMKRLYLSAARFYQAAPWTMIGGDSPIRLTLEGDGENTWGVFAMGQLGNVLGLSIIENIDDAVALIEDEISIEELTSLSVVYGENFDMAALDLWYLERNEWPVFGEEAYPTIQKFLTGMQPICPPHEELQMVASLLDAVPQFLTQSESVKSFTDELGRQFSLTRE